MFEPKRTIVLKPLISIGMPVYNEDKYLETSVASILNQDYENFELMPKARVIIDGAHNEDKIKYTLSNLKKIKYNKLWVIYGSSQNKPTSKILKPIQKVADKIILTKFKNTFRTSYDPHELAKKTKSTAVFLDNNQAMDYALKNAEPKDIVLVTGSFFLAGELRTRWFSEEHILKTRRSN